LMTFHSSWREAGSRPAAGGSKVEQVAAGTAGGSRWQQAEICVYVCRATGLHGPLLPWAI
jgi:hypothetical protein